MRSFDDGRPFMRRYWCGDVHGEYHQILIWIPDDFLCLLKYNGHVFIDATFRTVPYPFSQCVIVMAHDAGTNEYVPCAFCLLTGRNEYLYCNMLHEIIKSFYCYRDSTHYKICIFKLYFAGLVKK
ncbi:hypothetical protein RF11_02276 [Thelohanellus kitauei]|uniref:MULE transposase domain-containing protein n=1 Tax=Thelohanellus kitauei TaxID=669202 RepID=A0A0C2MP77_THEKT|nr:hypothetical protein RF11_02276 [Thelohanellus kitauei]